MAAASTCPVRPLDGACCDDGSPRGHINSTQNRPRLVVPIVPHPTLASSPPNITRDVSCRPCTPPSAEVEVDLASQSISSLNIMGAKETMLHVTELLEAPGLAVRVVEQPSMETVEETTELDATPSSSPSAKHRTPKRKRTASPPSPSSATHSHIRSTSRSTRRSAPPSTRHSSLYSHRRAVTTSSLTPSSHPNPDDLESRRQDLLALHRESCRLFQTNALPRQGDRDRDSERSAPSPSITRPSRTYSDLSTPPLSPLLNSISSRTGQRTPFPPPLRTFSAFTAQKEEGPISPIHPSATVIDWTSPSTRRREYQKIDRASRGVRGFWRRVAPRWARFGDDRTPFFEEKDGKGNYEGSVRRFRMDLPDEPAERGRGLKLKRKLVGRGRARSDTA